MAELISEINATEAKAWLHDVFIWGGLASTPKRTISIEKYRYMYGTHPDNFRSVDKKYREAAETICNCIKNRQVETQRFLAFDAAIKLISQCHFLPDITATSGNVREKPETLCAFIAWFCATNNLVYNNKNTSVEEIKQIKETLIGATLWDNYLFAVGHTPEMNPNKQQNIINDNKQQNTIGDAKTKAAPADNSTPIANTSASSGTTGTTTTTQVKAGGATGHTLYRNNASGILTQGKLTNIANNYYVYWIGGEFAKAGKTQPKLHVKPQNGKNPLKVDYGSGQGYNDCILYFASEQAAKNFLNIADANKPNTVKSLQIKKIGEDKNGYVEVATEFGNAYIKASKLHEEVEEDLENKEEKTYNYKEVAEAYFDGFFKD